MTAPEKTGGTSPGKDLDRATLERLPAAVRMLIQATPVREWPRIRACLVESQEEGDLAEILPEMNRVMRICPAKLVGLVQKREITGDELDQGYMKLHDAIHGVRQALYGLLHLAGYRDYRIPQASKTPGTPEGPAAPASSHRPEASPGGEGRPDPLAARPALRAGAASQKPAALSRPAKD